ncbi:DUF600 family protein [Nocardiopsis sp. N85]|uniref:immunity protein YezG family protein n=1 Tax=Nocardiopsis sp. N85 TaxID=3029400 RepID=UPI00237F30AC|nr:immunity protein YezG family protein [Nocardiopsis sp. N85]MDE3721233.1 DUF600 family protein [Nocardiopsis sp. N85]
MSLELIESGPEEWKEMDYRFEYIGGVAASERIVTFENGEKERKRHPHSVIKNAKTLKKEMYREDVGTWLSMSIHIIRPGKFKAEFNYDEEPGVHPIPSSPEDYELEMRKFPRSPDNVPNWIKNKIRRVES